MKYFVIPETGIVTKGLKMSGNNTRTALKVL
jgi:hypothetical protein